ncbi:MAG: hypothetical protein K5765_00710, partial [Clostridia bacterium]|nr:hypothetical protein [Clostridia bacterium]
MKAKTITSKVLLSIVATFTIAVTAIVLLLISGYSWFSDTRTVKPQINSSVLGSYFEDGTGTSDDPYIIKRPVQLYYFAWLQDLGAFNTVNDGTISQKYFKISDDVTS